MNKVILNTPEEIERINKEKDEIKSIIDNCFLKMKELGVNIDISRYGHIILNNLDFVYNHKDEKYTLDYKIQL